MMGNAGLTTVNSDVRSGVVQVSVWSSANTRGTSRIKHRSGVLKLSDARSKSTHYRPLCNHQLPTEPSYKIDIA